VLNHKTPNVEGKTDEQTNNQGMKVREAENGGSTKNSRTWAQVISKHANIEKEKEASNQGDNKQGNETKERQARATNVIIKGVREYGKNECTPELASDFLKDKLNWQGQICQAWRVGKPSDERARPIKVIMESARDKQTLLIKKHLLKGSRFFLEEDLTIMQQEEIKKELSKVRAARDEGKRAWLYKGKVVIVVFGPPSKARHQNNSQEVIANPLAENIAARLGWANRGLD